MNNYSEIEQFYLENHDFQVFCNKNIQIYGRTLAQELQNKITIEYYQTLQRGGCNYKVKKNETIDNNSIL